MPRKATVVGTEAKRVAGMMPEPKKKVRTTSTVTQIFCMVKRLTTGLSIVVARVSRNRYMVTTAIAPAAIMMKKVSHMNCAQMSDCEAAVQRITAMVRLRLTSDDIDRRA